MSKSSVYAPCQDFLEKIVLGEERISTLYMYIHIITDDANEYLLGHFTSSLPVQHENYHYLISCL